MRLHARFVLAADRLLHDAWIDIVKGRIIALGGREEPGNATVVRGRMADVVGFENHLILPGFVNAHTHLELSHMAGCVPPTGDLIDWLTRLVKEIIAQPPGRSEVEAAVRKGVKESLAAGVTTLADITRHPAWTRPILAASPLRAASFGEVVAIGKTRDFLAARLDAALDLCSGNLGAAEQMSPDPSRFQIGVSPHAPYTVERETLRSCAQAAHAQRLPLCIHLAESADEAAFTQRAEGRFRDYLRSLGVWDEAITPSGLDPIALAEATGVLSERTLAAHVNFVDDAGLDRLAAAGTHVVYCPRTHAAFGHSPHRFRDMLTRGINVCLGTDSLASNPSLSILEEIRFLYRRDRAIEPALLFEMATIRGARALGWEAVAGSLAPGKAADLLAIPLSSHAIDRGPLTNVLESDEAPCRVMASGQWVAPMNP